MGHKHQTLIDWLKTQDAVLGYWIEDIVQTAPKRADLLTILETHHQWLSGCIDDLETPVAADPSP